jgi:hypothetical protein
VIKGIRLFYGPPRTIVPGAYFAVGATCRRTGTNPETTMAKGLDKKKEQKKKPEKTLKEKRAQKSEKKAGKN